MSFYYFKQAIEEYKKDRNEDPCDSSKGFGDTFSSLLDSMVGWFSWCDDLLIKNWNFINLVNEKGELRKPKINLSVDITKKDNLILEWHPLKDEQSPWIYQKDFLRFDDQWYASQRPGNRIIMIYNIYSVSIPNLRTEKTSLWQTYLAKAVQRHLEYVSSQIKKLVDVVNVTSEFQIEIDKTTNLIKEIRVV